MLSFASLCTKMSASLTIQLLSCNYTLKAEETEHTCSLKPVTSGLADQEFRWEEFLSFQSPPPAPPAPHPHPEFLVHTRPTQLPSSQLFWLSEFIVSLISHSSCLSMAFCSVELLSLHLWWPWAGVNMGIFHEGLDKNSPCLTNCMSDTSSLVPLVAPFGCQLDYTCN